MDIHKILRQTSGTSPDPERALNNLERLFNESPELFEEYRYHIGSVARLFAYSQFLADYAIKNPSALDHALKNIHQEMKIKKEASESFLLLGNNTVPHQNLFLKKEALKLLRNLKKKFLLIITLKDIAGITNLNESMKELSSLAEAVLDLALNLSFLFMKVRFGDIKDHSFAVLGFGKLGADELNYSSDIDIISVYRSTDYISSGILSPTGVRLNRIDSHEYFCRMTEILANLLNSPTEDGIAYRVDLRLRPNGQKGALSLSINSYKNYYESWGKTWERMALIRARPVAGDILLGNLFISDIEPFVWKKSIDYNDIEEISELKKKIDTGFDTNDIKRGYGGIREIEFFVQTFQLLYGGQKHNLRTRQLISALDELAKEGLLSPDDSDALSRNYIFLRKIEHILQMKDDLQTHSLPSGSDNLNILALKMGFQNKDDFRNELETRRLRVRNMYNSLLQGTEVASTEILTAKKEMSDGAFVDYLKSKGFHDPSTSLKHIDSLTEHMSTRKTLRERNIIRKTISKFIELILLFPNKDKSLGILATFLRNLGDYESYIDLLRQRGDTRELIVTIFSSSTYLTRLLLGTENHEGIFEYPDIIQNPRYLEDKFSQILNRSHDPLKTIREFKMSEELKFGMLFLMKIVSVNQFSYMLSMMANIIIAVLVQYLSMARNFGVVGFGAFGARELHIGSDLDLVFIKGSFRKKKLEPSEQDERMSEELIRYLSEYTDQGYAYKIDMRLRPDGSKGVLSHDMTGYRNYYLKSAQPWEIQSLLRARPVAGDMKLLKSFHRLRKEIITKRGSEIVGSDMQNTRDRILQELSKERLGYDLKNGPGGIKEIEFLIQYLQLKHSGKYPQLIIQDTVTATKRLIKYGILERNKGNQLLNSHIFFRTIYTLIRLNEEDVLIKESMLTEIIIWFLELNSKKELTIKIDDARGNVLDFAEHIYRKH